MLWFGRADPAIQQLCGRIAVHFPAASPPVCRKTNIMKDGKLGFPCGAEMRQAHILPIPLISAALRRKSCGVSSPRPGNWAPPRARTDTGDDDERLADTRLQAVTLAGAAAVQFSRGRRFASLFIHSYS